MHCDLDLWPFDPKVNRALAHPWLMGNVPVKFHEDRCKGEAVMRMKQFYLTYALWPWPLTFWPKVDRAHPWLMGSVSVKFHEDRCKGEAVMHMKPFYLTHALWPWPSNFWPQGLQGPSLTHGECACEVSWRISVKEKQLCACNHFT